MKNGLEKRIVTSLAAAVFMIALASLFFAGGAAEAA